MSTTMQPRAELAARFPGLSEDAIVEALSILRVYNLTVSDLFFKWEAYVLASTRSAAGSSSSAKPEETLQPTLDNLRELRKEVAASVTSGNGAQVKREFQPSSVNGTPGGNHQQPAPSRVKKLGGRAALNGILDGLPSTPLAKRKLGASTPSTATPLARNGQSNGTAFRPSSYDTPQSKATALPPHLSRHTVTNGTPGPSTSTAPDSPSTTSSFVRFEDRKNPLEVVETVNEHLAKIIGGANTGSSSRVSMNVTAAVEPYNYRYMFEKVTERSNVLDAAIDTAADLIKGYYEIEDLGNPDFLSQDDIYCVGRICTEGDGVRMTDTSIHFESSRRYGSGGRVQLRFDPDMTVRTADDPSYAIDEGGIGLFAGAIVGIRGRNAGAGYFAVSEVLMMPPTDPPETAVSELIRLQHGPKTLKGEPMSVVTACGPYTLDDDLDYAPLAALMEELGNIRPDVVILLGPFVDASHPLIKTGEVDLTPTQIFNERVASKLASFLEYSPGSTAALIPSPRDIISHHVAFPQAPLSKSDGLSIHRRVRVLPNPAAFSINEVLFAATSVDTLFALKQSEYFKKCKDPAGNGDSQQDSQSSSSKDVMARICRHVMRQRSFYPLFPAPNAPPLDPLNLDVTHSELLKTGDVAGADIFILPSMLKHFAKIVDSTVLINPSSLARKNVAGTFAKLTIYPTSKSDLQASADEMQVDGADAASTAEHKLYERCRVDIVRV